MSFSPGLPIPILALDVPDEAGVATLLGRVPEARWVKVGLQLFTAAGPKLVERLVGEGRRVFLDLKFHDIPNTVAGAVGSAARLGVDLLTLHAAGGAAMLRAARAAAGGRDGGGPRLLAVTLLTSLSAEDVATTWGRTTVDIAEEALRLARLADDCGLDGVVASVHETAAIRARLRPGFVVLAPGIRLAGTDAGDQARIATPQQAAGAGTSFIVIGRTVTAAADPAAAWQEVISGTLRGRPE